MRQLQQCQGVAARLGHDPIAHLLIEGPSDHRVEQRSRVVVGQPLEDELDRSTQLHVLARLAHPEGDRNRLGPQPARDEGERLRRGPIEPLRVVHHAHQRSLRGHVG